MLGYGGGVGAFVTGAATYRVDLNGLVTTAWPGVPFALQGETARMWAWAQEKDQTYGLPEMVFRTCDALKRMWRERHPKIAAFWGDLETAVRNAAAGGGFWVAGRVEADKVNAWVRIKLPSGRYLSYPSMKQNDTGELVYKGQNQYTRSWSSITTYGGKLAENVTQAVCRDLLAESLVQAEHMGLGVVLHVHDEPVAENAHGDELEQAMTDIPWAVDLPLAVATYTTFRYHKE